MFHSVPHPRKLYSLGIYRKDISTMCIHHIINMKVLPNTFLESTIICMIYPSPWITYLWSSSVCVVFLDEPSLMDLMIIIHGYRHSPYMKILLILSYMGDGIYYVYLKHLILCSIFKTFCYASSVFYIDSAMLTKRRE